MPPFNHQSEQSLEALIMALAQQEEPLPEGVQKHLHSLAQNLEARIVEVPVVAASLPRLDQAYQAALANPANGDDGATLVSATSESPSDRLLERAVEIFTDPDPVKAAQRKQRGSLGQIASNPLKRLFGQG
ncbi:MAG: hypothetical protein AAF289_15480 [Cyanobacteria bacterium P01_A01_bin.135]